MPHQPSDIRAIETTAGVAGGVGVSDGTGIVSNQTPDVADPAHVAGRVADADSAEIVISHQTADVGASARATGGVAVTDGAIIVVTHQPTDVIVPAHTDVRVAVADRASIVVTHQAAAVVAPDHSSTGEVAVTDGSPVITDQSTAVFPIYAGVQHTHVANRAAHPGISDKPDIIHRWPIDNEIADGMAQAVEVAGKLSSRCTHRCKARACIPATGQQGIDVRSQRIVASQVAVHALQGSAGDITRYAQAVDDGEGLDNAIRTQFGTKVEPGGKIDLGTGCEQVVAGVACSHCALTIFKRETGSTRAVQVGVDVDIALGVEGELIG